MATLADILNDPSFASELSRAFPDGIQPLQPTGPRTLPDGTTMPTIDDGKRGQPGPGQNPVPNPPGAKGGGPMRTPPYQPPGTPPPGTPPGRPTIPPPPGTPPPSPPDRPRPDPPYVPPGSNPTPTPTPPGNDFNKGQVRQEPMPNGAYQPTLNDPYSSGFDPYNGTGPGSQSKGGQPGGMAGGMGGYGQNPLGYVPAPGVTSGAQNYDPLGIGQDNYGGGSYGGLPGSNQNVYDMTGVNAATGYQGPARYGIVGGQGGYGIGMVGPEYSGPIFDDANGALKAMRRQRRALNAPIQAQGGPAVAPQAAADPAAAGQSSAKGGQPPAATGATPATPAAGTPSSAKGGQPPAAAGRAPAASNPATGVTPPGQVPTSGPGYSYTPDGRLIMADPNSFKSQFGDLTLGSGGIGNQYKVNNGGGAYGYNANTGWEQWNDQNAANYVDPTQQQYQQGAGQLYRTQGYGRTPAPAGDTGLYTDAQGKNPYQANATANWHP